MTCLKVVFGFLLFDFEQHLHFILILIDYIIQLRFFCFDGFY